MYEYFAASMCVHPVCAWCPCKQEDGVRSPGTRGYRGLEAITWVLGTTPRYSARAAGTFTQWTISASPSLWYFVMTGTENTVLRFLVNKESISSENGRKLRKSHFPHWVLVPVTVARLQLLYHLHAICPSCAESIWKLRLLSHLYRRTCHVLFSCLASCCCIWTLLSMQ